MAYNFSKEEIQEMKEKMAGIGSYLPTNMTGYIWDKYKKISGNQTEPQPCTCKSSGRLWAKAVETVREYLKSVQ